jgi:hypothetical protein
MLAADRATAIGGESAAALSNASLPQDTSAGGDLPSLFMPSLLETLHSKASELPLPGRHESEETIGLVTAQTPEIPWLAWTQTTYLDLMADDAQTLAGFYDPFSLQFAYGDAGVQPYRLGWYSYNDFVLLPKSPTSLGSGFQDAEWNAWLRYAWLLRNSTVFTITGWMNGKFWTGPTEITLPPGGAQFIGDMQWASAYAGPWNWQVGFTPQLNGTFNDKINSNALMADGRAVLLYRASPQWMFAVGAAYWNRADDRFIPYGGVIWAPNDRWEIRATFPRSRASYFLGRFRGVDSWLYGSGEYDVQAYQVDLGGRRVSTRGETSEYRLLLGLSATTGIWTVFVEGGAATDRHFRFRGKAPDFTIDDTAFLRTGLLF